MWTRAIVAFSLAFWVWYWLVQRVFGPFNSDDLFFLHMFWLLRQGQQQYVDFYSYHLPTYFSLLTPLLPYGDSLNFAWAFRVLGVAIVAGYAAMVRPILWPFMLMFVVFARMTEVRADTVGLLLFNAAWFLLLSRRPRIVAAAALSGLALLFSARAAIMMVGMVPLLLWLARKEMPKVGQLLLLGAAFVVGVTLAALADPQWFELMIRSVFIDTTNNFARMPIVNRFSGLERAAPAAMLLSALAAGALALRRDRNDERALVILVASAAQLLLIVADPLPNGYAYGWAMIPAVSGLALAAKALRRESVLAQAGFASALGMLCLTVSYPFRNGPAPAGSYAKLTIDQPLSKDRIGRDSTPQLASLLLRPMDPWTQLRVREELCRRVRGEVAAFFWYQPVCLQDAMPQKWIGQFVTASEMREVLKSRPPELIVWGAKPAWPDLSGYSVYPGFAVQDEPK